MAEERGIVKYQARDGQEVTLSFQNVKEYLVNGNKDAVTNQELMYFLGVCKSRGLNPFKKDAYLIKYGGDPAAIVTSIDYFRSRARAQRDCVGWKKGIIVQKTDGSLRDSAGIILDGEKLIGGFFEATPEGWKTPFRLEVNLEGYIKKTKDGRTTRFWEKDNQPTMIAKVAEGQGLRTLWPDEFQGIYEEAEIRAPTIDMSKVQNGSYEKAEQMDTLKFDALVNQNITEDSELPLVVRFVKLSAKALSKTDDEIKVLAVEDFPEFLKQFRAWVSKQSDAAPGTTAGRGEPAETKTATSDQGPQPDQPKEPEKPKADPQAWDPLTADLMQRYVREKPKILIEACKKAGIEYAGKTPKEMHEALRALPKGAPEPPTGDQGKTSDPISDIFNGMEPDEKLAYCEKTHARIKTIAPGMIEETILETGMTWEEVKTDVDMAAEFVLYCLTCYRKVGKDYKALLPNGK